MTSRWFSLGTPVSSTNKIDRHDITEILLKVALKTIKQTNIYLESLVSEFINDHSYTRLIQYVPYV